MAGLPHVVTCYTAALTMTCSELHTLIDLRPRGTCSEFNGLNASRSECTARRVGNTVPRHSDSGWRIASLPPFLEFLSQGGKQNSEYKRATTLGLATAPSATGVLVTASFSAPEHGRCPQQSHVGALAGQATQEA